MLRNEISLTTLLRLFAGQLFGNPDPEKATEIFSETLTNHLIRFITLPIKKCFSSIVSNFDLKIDLIAEAKYR